MITPDIKEFSDEALTALYHGNAEPIQEELTRLAIRQLIKEAIQDLFSKEGKSYVYHVRTS